MKPIVHGIYQHYKGLQYKIVAIAQHSETKEDYVVYQALYGAHTVWVRPLSMFFEIVAYNGTETPRFTHITTTNLGVQIRT